MSDPQNIIDIDRQLAEQGVSDLLRRRIASELKTAAIEADSLRQSRANLSALMEELKEQVSLLVDERDEYAEAFRRAQMGLLTLQPPNKAERSEADLSPYALHLLDIIGKHPGRAHTFSALRQVEPAEEIQVLDGIKELYHGGLLTLAQDDGDPESFKLSDRGMRRLRKQFKQAT